MTDATPHRAAKAEDARKSPHPRPAPSGSTPPGDGAQKSPTPKAAVFYACDRCGHDRSEHEYEAFRDVHPDGSIEEEYRWGPCEVEGCSCSGWIPPGGGWAVQDA